MNIENQNQTLESLLLKVQQQSARKQDYTAPTNQLQVSTAMGPDEKKNKEIEKQIQKEFEEAEAAAIKQELAEKAKKDAKEKNNLDFKHDK